MLPSVQAEVAAFRLEVVRLVQVRTMILTWISHTPIYPTMSSYEREQLGPPRLAIPAKAPPVLLIGTTLEGISRVVTNTKLG